MGIIFLLSLLLPLFVLFHIRFDIIDSIKQHKGVWASFAAIIVATLVVIANTTDPIIAIVILSLLGGAFLFVSTKATIKSLQARKFYNKEATKYEARRLQLAKSPIITENVALALIHEYLNKPSPTTLKVLIAVASNKRLPKNVIKHMLTLSLPQKAFIALAGNKGMDSNLLAALAVKDGITEDVFSAILDNKKVSTQTVRNIIAELDDPYSLIDGGSPQVTTAHKAIELLKERTPEIKDIDDRYIIASCSPLF